MILKLYSGGNESSCSHFTLCTETHHITKVDEGKEEWTLPIHECSWQYTQIKSFEHFLEKVYEEGFPQWRQEVARYYDSMLLGE